MRVVEVFLPLNYGDGQPVPSRFFELIEQEITEQFGGVTAYTRAPARGLWKQGGEFERDTIVVIEVMTDKFHKDWWKGFKQRMELLLRQKEILIRSTQTTKI